MKTKKQRLVWKCDSRNNKIIELELKKKAEALLMYARKKNIGHLSLTVIGDDYATICAKPYSRSNDYVVDAYAFIEEKVSNE